MQQSIQQDDKFVKLVQAYRNTATIAAHSGNNEFINLVAYLNTKFNEVSKQSAEVNMFDIVKKFGEEFSGSPDSFTVSGFVDWFSRQGYKAYIDKKSQRLGEIEKELDALKAQAEKLVQERMLLRQQANLPPVPRWGAV